MLVFNEKISLIEDSQNFKGFWLQMILSTFSLTFLSGLVSAFESQGTVDLKNIKQNENIFIRN